MASSPWRKDMWCIPQVDGEYVVRTQDVVDLYAAAPDPKPPVVCFDESPCSSSGASAHRGRVSSNVTITSIDYRRNGTVNLFVFLDVQRPWRKVKVTERRTARDYAQCMCDLVDIHYPDAEIIRVVQDNLSTHSAGAVYQALPPAEARRILFHCNPKPRKLVQHGRNRNRRPARPVPGSQVDNPKRVRREIAAWEWKRNAARSHIKWMFTTEKARAKMGHAYPATSKGP